MPNAVVVGSVLAAVVAAGAIAVLRRFATLLPADVPNARSLHVLPVPRAGGYAIWAGFLPAALLFPPPFPGGLAGWMPAWAALFAVSAQDDRGRGRRRDQVRGPRWRSRVDRGVAGPRGRCSVGGTAMTMLYVAGCALALAWSANLFNFMDGSDGLAAAMGIIGFGAYGLAAILGGPATGAVADERASAAGAAPALLALAAAIVPFLAVNRPRASMFLGDVGAVPLGFLAAAFGIEGIASGRWPSWFPLLVFLPFVADATVTLLRRVARGERVWEAHRSHYYQRLHRLGAGHAGTLAAYGGCDGRHGGAARSPAWSAHRRPGRGHLRCAALSSSCCSRRLIIIGERRRPPGPPMTRRFNWRAALAFVHDVCVTALAWIGDLLAALQPRPARALRRGHVVDARVDRAAAGDHLPVARPLSRPVALSRACPTCSASCSPRGWARS